MNRLDPRTSLRARLAIAIGGVSLLLAFLLSLVLGATARQDLEERTGNLLALLASQTACQLDHELYERYHEVQVLATLDTLKNPHTSRDEKRALLEQLQRAYPEFVWVGATDAKGTVLAATGGVLEGESIAARPVFAKGMSGPALSDVHDTVMLAHLVPHQSEGRLRLADISAPIIDAQGTRVGVLAAHLDVNWARGVEDAALASAQGGERLHGLLLRRDRTVLLGPKTLIGEPLEAVSAQYAEAGREGYAVEPWRGDKDNVIGYAPTHGYLDCPGLGWLVIVRQNADAAYAPARQIQETTLVWGLAFGVLASALGWLIAGRITRPVTATALAADRLRLGIRDAALPVLAGDDEIAVLSRSLQGLVNALTSSEARYRLLLDTANEGILVVDRDDTITYLNARMASMLGHSPEDLAGKPFGHLLFPADAAGRRRADARVSKPDRYEQRLRHSNGTEVWGLASISATQDDGPAAGTITMVTDITERKHAEDALRQSEEQLRLAYNAANLASWDWNVAEGAMHWSALFEDLFGLPLPEDQIPYSDWLSLVVAEDRGAVLKTLTNALETGDSGAMEYRILHPARGLRWMQSVGKVFRNSAGDPTRMLGVASDITVRKRQELEMTISYQKQSRIAETLQRSLLSKPATRIAGLDFETVYRPASDEAQIGGDYYDIFPLQRGEIAFVVGDVSGKGLDAAARTAEIKYALRAYLRRNPDPAYALAQLNNFLCDSKTLDGQSAESFVALTLAVITPATGRVQMALGGVDAPLLVTSNARVIEIDAEGMPLGILPHESYDLTLLALNPGDTLLIATDGLFEARQGAQFLGREGLGHVAQEAFAHRQPLSRVGETIVRSVQAFSGGRFRDDVCLLLARRT